MLHVKDPWRKVCNLSYYQYLLFFLHMCNVTHVNNRCAIHHKLLCLPQKTKPEHMYDNLSYVQ